MEEDVHLGKWHNADAAYAVIAHASGRAYMTMLVATIRTS